MNTISSMVCAFACVLGMSATNVNAATETSLQKKTLSVGADLNYPPYDYFVDGKPAGFDPSLLALLAKKMNVELTFSDTRFASLLLGLKSNRFDLASAGMYVTPERAQQINFLPYMKTGVSFVVLKGSANQPMTPADLCGLRVSSIQGAAWIPKLTEFSKTGCVDQGKAPIKLSEFPSSAEAVQTLFAKTADVQTEDAAVAAVAVKNTSGRIEISSKEILYPVVGGYGLRNDNQVLLAAMTKALQAIKDSGEYAALLKEYNLGEPSKEEIAAAMGTAN